MFHQDNEIKQDGYARSRKPHASHIKRNVSYSVKPRSDYVSKARREEVPIKSIPREESVTITVDHVASTEKVNAVHHKKKSKKDANNYEKRQTIERHVDELRKRALYCVVALTLGGLVGYHFQTQIIDWLVKPLGQQLFYTSPTGGFDFLIKICLFFGFLLAIPVIIYNIIRFLAPAVPKRVTYSTSKILIFSIILAISGVAFAYFVSLPAALKFLNNFNNAQVQSLISAQEYFNFVMIYLAGFAALFQMPLIFAFVNKITPLKPKALIKKQRVVILVSFIVAAVLTPTPDPMNQTLMAVPIIGLYQTSIGVVWQDNKRKTRKEAKKVRKESQLAPV